MGRWTARRATGTGFRDGKASRRAPRAHLHERLLEDADVRGGTAERGPAHEHEREEDVLVRRVDELRRGGKGVEGAGGVSHMRGAVTADRRARRCIARTLGFSSADSGSTGLSVALTGVTIATSRVWRASALAADQGHSSVSFYSFTRHRRQLVHSHRLISHEVL